MVRDDVKHKIRLSNETCVASADNNDPIYILRKEIHDWRVSGQLTDGFEHECRLTKDETEKSSVRDNHGQTVAKDLPDPGVLHKLPSSTAIDHLTRRTENSSSPETCNDGVCSTTSPGEMTSVRTCYCKHEGNVARKKDNDIRIHNGNRQPATAASKKSIVTSKTWNPCGSDRESRKRAKCVTNEETLQPGTSRPVEAQPSNLILSPETSIALENAEKIISNAKMQLIEVCATSSFDSARRNRNTFSDEPPLDDETEERLYVRELVTSKIHDACSSRLSEANGSKASERSEKRDSPRVTVRRVDLTTPKFRVFRRRRADWSSLGYGSNGRSRGRASHVRRLSDCRRKNRLRSRTRRRRRQRPRRRLRLRRRRLAIFGERRWRENACEIQIGPSVHIVDRELTRQDLEDVHISPEPFRTESRANTATYTLCHEVILNADNGAHDPEVSGTPRTRRVRMDSLQRGKPIGTSIVEAATEAVPTTPAEKIPQDVGNSEQFDERVESPRDRDYGQERKDRGFAGARVSERSKDATSRGAVKFAVIETSRGDRNEKSKNKARRESHEEIVGDAEIRYAEDDGIFCGMSDAERSRNDDESDVVDKIQAKENRGDRSKPPPAGDISRRAGFPRRENIASRCREEESPRPYRTIDEHFSRTFNSHNGQDGPRDVAGRSFDWGCAADVSQAEDNLDNEIDLYRPRLDDLDSILHANDRKIERIVRGTRNLSELLSECRLNEEEERKSRDADREKLGRDSSADKNRELASKRSDRSSVLEIELRNEELTVSETRRTSDDEPLGTNATENGSRSNYSKNSVESSVFPASGGTSRDSDEAQRSAAKARLSETSMDGSDATTTFSNLVPALSSTHTETSRQREEKIARDNASKLSGREIRSGKGYIDDGGSVFAQLFQKNASQVADQLVTYILQDEKRRSVGGRSLREATPAAVQKLLNHLREAESIRDARQTETMDILQNILINVKSQSDRGNTNDRETRSRDTADSSVARTNAPSTAIDVRGTSRDEKAREIQAKIDVKDSYELEGLDERVSNFSECRETARDGDRSTARCESTRRSENNDEKDAGLRRESADVAKIVLSDAKNQADQGVDENSTAREETLSRNVADISRLEGTISRTRAKDHASDIGQIVGESNTPGNPDEHFPPAIPETRESVRFAVHFEAARGSKNNNKSNSKENSEAESLKQIPDIRSDNEKNPKRSSEHLQLSTKIAFAKSREECNAEATDSVVAIAVSGNKEDCTNVEKLGEDKTNDVQANKDQQTSKSITNKTDQMIDARSDVPEEAVKEVASEKIRDGSTPADKGILFAPSEVSGMKNERVRSDASSARSKFADENLTKKDAGLVHSSAKEDTESGLYVRYIPKERSNDPADNYSTNPLRDSVLTGAEKDVSSLREDTARNKQISFDIAGEDNSTGKTRNEKIRKSTTFAVDENRRNGNEIPGPQKTARNDNVRQPIDLTDAPRKYKIDVLSSSNSSISSTLLDHDDRSTNGELSANVRRIGTTSETSHSEGELYMPSSCSYSLGEVRVLRKRDLIEDNVMDRDSSVTVLVTRSMLTSLNDSTVSLLESSGRV
ncbi:LOW QUALITY PROTEIN: uncharacterized protein LOC105195553 [Solenopsis invicta]|uniref:LOW QUALITY PROTEIN: uncharacterized protein LOC105195553 n=1 Tax=Solenopsis invicta TaxID=13686 RepID=UPI00193E908D|nr:LOW QUALITY PROTEIN: uncharacterized protein LOC105195553 [Solenopsis invicta]